MVDFSQPEVEPTNLSSNWKTLQKTLKSNASERPIRKSSGLRPQLDRVFHRKAGIHSQPSQHQSHRSDTISKNKLKLKSCSKAGRTIPPNSLAIWADDNDIPRKDLEAAYGALFNDTNLLSTKVVPSNINEGISPTTKAGKYVAIDCEMVGVGPTPDFESALARVSLVDYHGHQLYDSFVQPKEPVTDYRTNISGITPQILQTGRDFGTVQADVAQLIDGKTLIGHAISNDLAVLLLGHPKRDIRDSSKYPPFRELAGGKTPSLKKLARNILGVDIQGGKHSSVEDARATMLLFRKEKEGFERERTKNWRFERKDLDKSTAHELRML